MKIPAFLFICLFFQIAYSQQSLNVFDGSFDDALALAKKKNKDIFFITKSLTCGNYSTFRDTLDNNPDASDFVNNEFIVFIFNRDVADEKELKRLKKYYHSWWGYPQIYFIDSSEKLISNLAYHPDVNFKDQLKVWKSYKTIEEDWKDIKKQKRRGEIDYQFVQKYIIYRQIIPLGMFAIGQINNVISRYFKSIDTNDYYLNKNWVLIKENILYKDIFSDQRLFTFVERHRKEFIQENGREEVSEYLLDNYMRYLSFKKEKKVERLSKKYPFTTIPEAKRALKLDKTRRMIL